MPVNYLSCPLLLSEAVRINISYMPQFLKFSVERGFAASTIRQYLGPILHFESWRRRRPKTQPVNLSGDIKLFIYQHLRECDCPRSLPRSKKCAQAALTHWRPICDPQWANDPHPSPQAQLIDSYEHYLIRVVGLAPSTRCYRRRYAAEFLDWLATQSITLSQLAGLHIGNYIVVTTSINPAADHTNQRTSSLKSFINFLVSEGKTSVGSNPSIAQPKVPHNIAITHPHTDDELSRLLQAFDRTQPIGKRDYAMARCLINLGVRTSEVAGFSLGRIDWRRGYVTLTPGKFRRERILPMPATTIDGLTDYLRCARPATQDRHVFVHHRAPLGKGVQASTVRGAVRRAYARAGFKPSESQLHRLRHTMATRLLQNKHSLKTIADVLGHLSINTTTRYTHIDRRSLTAVAMPWPRRGT